MCGIAGVVNLRGGVVPALQPSLDDGETSRLRARVTALAQRHPLYPELGE